jgi:hypothetical protein
MPSFYTNSCTDILLSLGKAARHSAIHFIAAVQRASLFTCWRHDSLQSFLLLEHWRSWHVLFLRLCLKTWIQNPFHAFLAEKCNNNVLLHWNGNTFWCRLISYSHGVLKKNTVTCDILHNVHDTSIVSVHLRTSNTVHCMSYLNITYTYSSLKI